MEGGAMRKWIRNSLSRVLAGVLVAGGSWLGLSEAAAQEFSSGVLVALTLVVYGLIHKGLDQLGINPGDTAGSD